MQYISGFRVLVHYYTMRETGQDVKYCRQKLKYNDPTRHWEAQLPSEHSSGASNLWNTSEVS